MERLRKVIICQVNIQENVSHFVSTNVHGKGRCEHDHVNKVKGYHTDNKHEHLQKSSAEVFSSVSNNTGKNHSYPGNMKSVQVLRPCIFCQSNHYNDECNRYTTVSERKKVLNQQKRCFICLKTGHMLKQCPVSIRELVVIVAKGIATIGVCVQTIFSSTCRIICCY